MESDATDFGALLRRHRGAAGMTQEALAERSGLSTREIRRLERVGGHGKGHKPRPSTVAYLASALDLSGAERRSFEEAALRAPDSPGATTPEPTGIPPGGPTEPLTPLLGRDELVGEAVGLLGRKEVRLLTLVGPGGVGKTRVGLRVARELGPRYGDGAVVVGLSTVYDPALVAPAIARAVGLGDAGARPAVERLLDHLRAGEMLLLPDNFEQVREAAPFLVGLLSGCPGLEAIVTSRAALRVRGEQELVVPPLETPGPYPPGIGVAEVSRSPAFALFVERARAVDPALRVTDENAPVVAGICRHLDGLPLAGVEPRPPGRTGEGPAPAPRRLLGRLHPGGGRGRLLRQRPGSEHRSPRRALGARGCKPPVAAPRPLRRGTARDARDNRGVRPGAAGGERGGGHGARAPRVFLSGARGGGGAAPEGAGPRRMARPAR